MAGRGESGRNRPGQRDGRTEVGRIKASQTRWRSNGEDEMKKTPRKKAVERLDKAFSKFIRQRDGMCVMPDCYKTQNLHAGHLITRCKYSVRWDEENCFAQCAGHNFEHENHPEKFTLWYIKMFGPARYIDLVERSNKIRKFTTVELLAMAEEYENQLKGKK